MSTNYAADDRYRPAPSDTRRPLASACLAVLLCVVALFYIATIKDGHTWGGDFSLYLAHANNLLRDQPYANTGYIYNPEFAVLSPQVYPPVFPAILASVQSVFGADLYIMKVAVIVALLLFLGLYYCFGKARLTTSAARLAAVAAVAFSPWVWKLKDDILADLPFLAFTYGALVLMDRLRHTAKGSRASLLLAIAVGLCCYLAYGTRSVGLLLIPALLLSECLRARSCAIGRAALIASLVFAVPYVIQNSLLHSDQAYMGSLTQMSLAASYDNLWAYAIQIASFWRGVVPAGAAADIHAYLQQGSSAWLALLPAGVMLSVCCYLAIVGYRDRRAEPYAVENVFAILYLAVLTFVPFNQSRYLLPVYPLFILYVFRGAECLSHRWGRLKFSGRSVPSGVALPISLVLTMAVFYAATYRTTGFPTAAGGIERQASHQVFEFVRRQTRKDSVILFAKPRVMALLGGRKSSIYPRTDDPDRIWSYVREIGATHIVTKYHGWQLDDSAAYRDVIVRYAAQLTAVFENDEFRVYRVNPLRWLVQEG